MDVLAIMTLGSIFWHPYTINATRLSVGESVTVSWCDAEWSQQHWLVNGDGWAWSNWACTGAARRLPLHEKLRGGLQCGLRLVAF